MQDETGIRKTLKILRLLIVKEHKVNDLVELTGIHQRQVYRAIAVIKESGYKVTKKKTVYRAYFNQQEYERQNKK